MPAAVTALTEATQDADATGVGYVRITANRVHDGITYDIERVRAEYVPADEPTQVRTAPEIEDEHTRGRGPAFT
jgi:hypothetical protein